MYRKGETQKEAVIAAANRLFYERGYANTSFTDIARSAGFPRGNFYHYFKSKGEILQAVVAARMAGISDRLTRWEAELATPLERLRRFARILPGEAADVVRFGCPMGTLNTEMAKGDRAGLDVTRAMFELFRPWLARQFAALDVDDPEGLARQLLARTQGAALLAHVYGDADLLAAEAYEIERWLERVAAAGG